MALWRLETASLPTVMSALLDQLLPLIACPLGHSETDEIDVGAYLACAAEYAASTAQAARPQPHADPRYANVCAVFAATFPPLERCATLFAPHVAERISACGGARQRVSKHEFVSIVRAATARSNDAAQSTGHWATGTASEFASDEAMWTRVHQHFVPGIGISWSSWLHPSAAAA